MSDGWFTKIRPSSRCLTREAHGVLGMLSCRIMFSLGSRLVLRSVTITVLKSHKAERVLLCALLRADVQMCTDLLERFLNLSLQI
jgi:hypothetical protein